MAVLGEMVKRAQRVGTYRDRGMPRPRPVQRRGERLRLSDSGCALLARGGQARVSTGIPAYGLVLTR